jgi:hypothetical protein
VRETREGCTNVQAITLDNILELLKHSKIENGARVFLKIDVEGFELHAIRGARKLIAHYSPTLILETNAKNLAEVQKLLPYYCFRHVWQSYWLGTVRSRT